MHPPGRPGGDPGPATKNPERARIAALAPDLVIANREENCKLDVARLRETSLAVWVTVKGGGPGASDKASDNDSKLRPTQRDVPGHRDPSELR